MAILKIQWRFRAHPVCEPVEKRNSKVQFFFDFVKNREIESGVACGDGVGCGHFAGVRASWARSPPL